MLFHNTVESCQMHTGSHCSKNDCTDLTSQYCIYGWFSWWKPATEYKAIDLMIKLQMFDRQY